MATHLYIPFVQPAEQHRWTNLSLKLLYFDSQHHWFSELPKQWMYLLDAVTVWVTIFHPALTAALIARISSDSAKIAHNLSNVWQLLECDLAKSERNKHNREHQIVGLMILMMF